MVSSYRTVLVLKSLGWVIAVYRGKQVYVVLYGLVENVTALNDRKEAGVRRTGTARRDARAGTLLTLKLAMRRVCEDAN